MPVFCLTSSILGSYFDHNGLSINDAKISIVKNYPRPTTLRRVKSFLAMTSYFRRFLKDFSRITTPLRALLKQDAKFKWTDECEEVFQYLKNALITAPILALPNFNRPFILTTDASQFAISFILRKITKDANALLSMVDGRYIKMN
jgi:hypothetical protein